MIYNTNMITCEYQAEGHHLFELRDFFLDLFETNFGEALNQMTVFVYVKFPDDKLNDPKNLKSNRWLESKQLTQPKVRFLRDKKKLKVEYVTRVPGAENEFSVNSKDADSFSNYCLEFIDILLKYLPGKIKPSDDFRLDAFLQQLKAKRASLPIGEPELMQLRKADEDFDRRRLLVYFQRTPAGKGAKRIPKLIPIQHVDGNTPCMGTFRNGQFWGLTVEGFRSPQEETRADQNKYVYSVLHIFDRAGKHVETNYEKILLENSRQTFEMADTKLKCMLDAYAPYNFGDIKIELFEKNIDGMTFGLINESDEEEAKVEMAPEGYMLCPPWTGYFDT